MGHPPALPLHSLTARACNDGALLFLALAVLITTCLGRAGVQQVDSATIARLARLHLHGVAGEAAYVHDHHAPAPFVPDHCHAPTPQPAPQPGPDDTLAAASLAGAALCADLSAMPVLPAVLPSPPDRNAAAPASARAIPATPPPRA